MKQFMFLFMLMPFGVYAQKQATITILPNDSVIEYSGRVDYSNPLKPSFCYAGVSVSTVFTGTSVGVVLSDMALGDEQHTNYFEILVDDSSVFVLEAKVGKHKYELCSGLKSGKHHIEVFKRTECSVGSTLFLGFTAPEGTVFEKPISKNHRIEFIGNSLTCGYGNELSIAAPPAGNPNTGFHSKNENNYLAYGALISRNLKAYYRCIAYSGRGLYRNNTSSTEGTMPKIYHRIFPDEASVLWDVQKEVPDVVVINLGSNDFYPESKGDFLNDVAFKKTYLLFLEELRKNYPNAKIICVVGNGLSDYWPEGRKCWTRIQQIVSDVVQITNDKGDKEVYYFKLNPQTPPYGEDWHPSIPTHKKMAEALTPFIQEVTGW